MIETLIVEPKEEGLTLISDVTYSHAVYWFNNTMRPLKMSIVMPKYRGEFQTARPAIVWLCGGGFETMDKDVWIPQLVSFAKKGYVVASVEYRTNNESVFPAPVVDIKAAIRFLRAHAGDFFIDPNRISLGGESAGGCLALLVGATEDVALFEQGDHLDQSSKIQAILNYYGTARLDHQRSYPREDGVVFETEDTKISLGWAEPLISSNMPPVITVHGDKDEVVDVEDSYWLHERLQELNVPNECLLIKDATHGVDAMYQPEVNDRVIAFLDKVMPKLS